MIAKTEVFEGTLIIKLFSENADDDVFLFSFLSKQGQAKVESMKHEEGYFDGITIQK